MGVPIATAAVGNGCGERFKIATLKNRGRCITSGYLERVIDVPPRLVGHPPMYSDGRYHQTLGYLNIQ
ncbi:MAG: hypothetical protein AAFR30_03985, partial [Cyanobacteria bacterium J06628_4]